MAIRLPDLEFLWVLGKVNYLRCLMKCKMLFKLLKIKLLKNTLVCIIHVRSRFHILHSNFCAAYEVENISDCFGIQITEYPSKSHPKMRNTLFHKLRSPGPELVQLSIIFIKDVGFGLL